MSSVRRVGNYACPVAILALLSALPACSGPASEIETEPVAEQQQAVSAGRVVAYVDGTAGPINVGALDATKYTHINYAFANLDGNGNVYSTFGAQDENNINALKGLKNQNPNLKILVSIGGWTWSNNFSWVAGDSGRRANMVASAWNYVNSRGLDGVDVDWEWPGWQGEGDNGVCAGTCDGQRLQWLMRDLWNSGARGGKLVTMAGAASSLMGAYVDLSNGANGLGPYVSFLNIMTYDFHGNWEAAWNHHANVYGGDISIDSAVNMYLGEGFPASKLVVGMPFYGRSWNVPGDGAPLYKNISCNGTGAGSACGVNGAWGYTLRYDTAKQAAYLDGNGGFVSFDNLVSIGWKTTYINNRGLGGGMYWSALQDNASRDLTNKIWADLGGGGGGGTTRYKFVARHSGKCFDVSAMSADNGANIQQWTCNGSNAQSFYLEGAAAGYVRIKNTNSNKCVDVGGWSTENWGNLIQWSCGAAQANQEWLFEDMGGGGYRIRSRHSGRCADVDAWSHNDGANIHQWDCTTGNNQIWQRVAL